jgi:hypothetical protein
VIDFSELGAEPEQQEAPQQEQSPVAAPATTTAATPAKVDFSDLGAKPVDFSDLGGQKATPAAAPAEEQKKPHDEEGFWKGVWDDTLGPIFEEARANQAKADKMDLGDRLMFSLKTALQHTPDAQIPQMVYHAVKGAYVEGKKAVKHAGSAASEGTEAVKSLAQGKTDEAIAHGRTASGELSQAQGHGMAAVLPIVGPEAANIGEEAGAGNVKHAAGRATGLIATVAAPSGVEGTAEKASTKVASDTAKATEIANAEATAATARTTAKQATEDAATAATTAERESQAGAATVKQQNAATQNAARTTITNGARQAAENALEEVNKARAGAPEFTPIDSKAEAANVNSYGEAADKIQEHAKAIYQKLDEVSEGQFTQLREAIKANNKAIYEGADKNAGALGARLDRDMENLFAKYGDQVGPNDLKAATAAWRTSKVLEEINTAVERSISGAPESIAQRAGTGREVIGKQLNKRLNKVLENIPREDVEKAIGQEGLDNLYRMADMTSTPAKTTATAEAASNVAKELQKQAKQAEAAAARATEKAKQLRGPEESVGKTIVQHMTTKAIASTAGAFAAKSVGVSPYLGTLLGITTEQAARSVWQRALISPRVGKMLQGAVSVGADSRVYAPLIAQQIRKEAEETNEDVKGKKK